MDEEIFRRDPGHFGRAKTSAHLARRSLMSLSPCAGFEPLPSANSSAKIALILDYLDRLSQTGSYRAQFFFDASKANQHEWLKPGARGKRH
jgi:hypothetical protein